MSSPRLRKAARDGPHGYTSPIGIPALREAVAAHVAGRFKVPVSADEVVIVPGGKVTFYFACLLFGGPGSEILYPDPGFPPYREAIRSGGATGVPYPIREERDFGFDADEVLSLITPRTRLIIINSPANPTGGVVDAREIEKLAEGLLRFPGVAVLSDEIYSQLVFTGSRFESFLTFPELRERTILLDGWSKTFAMTGLAARLRHLAEVAGRACPQAHHRRSFLHQRRRADWPALRRSLARWTRSSAFARALKSAANLSSMGLMHCPAFPAACPGVRFMPSRISAAPADRHANWREDLLEKKHVALIPGESFGANGAGYLRLSYAASEQELTDALARMRDYLAS